MNPSKIEWTEATWSPVIGCTKVSQGCKHCYAEREVETRWSKNPKSIWYGRSFTDVLCRPEAIAGAGSPLRWRKPRRIFVCPRADLFHDDVPAKFIADVFGVMAASPQHTFQVLTKRPARMLNMLGAGRMGAFDDAVEDCMAMYTDAPLTLPLPNVHLGVSIEDQATADERIPLLLQTPAAVRWVSAEPLLEAVDLRPWLHPEGRCKECGQWICVTRESNGCECGVEPTLNRGGLIDWVVAGGESGPEARPMHPDWVRGLRDQCATACVPFLFKQWGEWAPDWNGAMTCTNCGNTKFDCVATKRGGGEECGHCGASSWEEAAKPLDSMCRVGKRAAGRMLDGVLHDAYPEVRS